MKNKQAIIGIVAAIIIVLGAGGFLLLSKTKTATQPNNTTAATTSSTSGTNSMMQGSIQDIFSGGKNQKCDFDTKTSSGGETKGIISVSSDKAYGNFAMTTNGKVSNMYMIRNGETFYIWGDSIPTGIKMTISVNDMASKMSGSSYSNFDPSKKVDFKCSPWNVDESLFTPPASVKFTDVGSMMGGTSAAPTGTNTTNSTASQCNLCNSLTGAAKSTCKTSFNCQ